MTLDLQTIAQILVLSVGAGVVFSFLRTTRGSGMIRGVLIALFVVFGALLGVAKWFGLAELEFIVEGVTGFAVVILAIVFQPELRRGIVSLGDNPLVRSVIRSATGDAVDEVAAACVQMAKNKKGALIAFERDTPLDPWTQTAQRVDSRVNRFLLDAIFNTDSALHDGAVIIREDRVAAAGAILPLSENDKLAQSVGTRHRAALGLSEETDAVVVAVSEETGLITVCQDGKMERRVLREELAEVLKSRLGGTDDVDAKPRSGAGQIGYRIARFGAWCIQNPMQKLTALTFGLGLYVLAFRQVQATESYVLRVEAVTANDGDRGLKPGWLRIVLPDSLHHLVSPRTGMQIEFSASAPRVVFDGLPRGIGGVLEVEDVWVGTERKFDVASIRWGGDRYLPDLIVGMEESDLKLQVQKYSNKSIDLSTTESLRRSEEAVRAAPMPPNVELVEGSLEFDPPVIGVSGPSEAVEQVVADPSLLEFEPLDLTDDTGSGFVAKVELRRRDSKDPLRDLALEDTLFVRGSLQTRETVVGTFERDVVLVSFDATDPTERFLPPTETVTVVVKSRGLLTDAIDPDQRTIMVQQILSFVRENARVFVDVGRVVDSGTTRADVEVGDLSDLWPDALGDVFQSRTRTGDATLRIEIDELDRTVVLIPRSTDDDAND